jgi:hypothetical protein
MIQPIILHGAKYLSIKGWHVQQLSVDKMRMLGWICGNTKRDRVRNDNIREILGVAPVEENLVQYYLRWFEHIQQRPTEAPIYNGVIRQTGNEKRDTRWSNLTCEKSGKRNLKDWCIIKELALDRKEWKLVIHVSESWSSILSFLLFFIRFFSPIFAFLI